MHHKVHQKVENYVRDRFEVGTVLYQWSSQYYIPADGLPYIGENPIGGRSLVATGFGRDTLVFGTVAGILLSDMLTGISNNWKSVYTPKRFTPIVSAKEVFKESADVAYHLVADRIRGLDDHLEKLASGEGKIVNLEGEKLGICRDRYNELHIVSPVCTHLKCIVQWNNSEESWDCPCHGSRYDAGGKVISGPAVENLEKRRLHSSSEFPGKKG